MKVQLSKRCKNPNCWFEIGLKWSLLAFTVSLPPTHLSTSDSYRELLSNKDPGQALLPSESINSLTRQGMTKRINFKEFYGGGNHSLQKR